MAASTSSRRVSAAAKAKKSVPDIAGMSKIPPTPTPALVLAAWPSRSPANFSQLSEDPWTKMIRPPKAYHATHDTMPPSEQVITMQPTHARMKEYYQATDQKLSGKRNSSEQGALPSSRHPKQPRAS